MAKKKKNKEKKKGGIASVPMILAGLVLAFFLQGSFIFLLLGLLPSIVAYYADISKGKDVFRVVFACNLSGVLPFLADLVIKNNNTTLLLQLLSDPMVWLIMYLSAGFGYLLIRGMPYMVEFFYEFINITKISRLQSMQNKLLEEWGPEIQRSE